jgi:hypothetical protein
MWLTKASAALQEQENDPVRKEPKEAHTNLQWKENK